MTDLKKLLLSSKGSMSSNYMLVSAAAIVGIMGGAQAAQKTSAVFLQDAVAQLELARFEVPGAVCAPHVEFRENGTFKSVTNGLPHKIDRLMKKEGQLAVYCDKMGSRADAKGETMYSGGWLTQVVSEGTAGPAE